jgi:hypothetical protein
MSDKSTSDVTPTGPPSVIMEGLSNIDTAEVKEKIRVVYDPQVVEGLFEKLKAEAASKPIPTGKGWKEALSSRTLWMTLGFFVVCLVGVWADALPFTDMLNYMLGALGIYGGKSGMQHIGSGLKR